MSERFDLPTVADLQAFAEPHERAITVYARTSPDDREKSLLTVKSAVDNALRTLREQGISHNTEQALREAWAAHEASTIWGRLSASVVLLLADDVDEMFVLPNEFDDRLQVGAHFDLSQLIRAVTTPQEAFALTLSQNGWNLWHATATGRATELPLRGEHPADIAEATNRATVRDRSHVRRLVGDEGRGVLLRTYAQRVAEAVSTELAGASPEAPLFVFAAAPLLDLYREADLTGRRLETVAGAPDELAAHDIDEAIRAALPGINAAAINATLERLGDEIAQGTVARDLADIARATTLGAVDTLVYDITASETGSFDPTSGAITYDADGYQLLSRIALQVLQTGGTVHAVRPGEVTSVVWLPPAVAGLRFTLA